MVRSARDSAWTQLKYLVAVLEAQLYTRIHSMCHRIRYLPIYFPSIFIISQAFHLLTMYHHWLLVLIDSSFGEKEGRKVCKEGQSKDKEENARDVQSSGAWWVCRYVERLILYIMKWFILVGGNSSFAAACDVNCFIWYRL